MKRLLCASAVLLLVVSSAMAQTPPSVPAPLVDAPTVYVVKPGDTLWGIAERFFGDPFSWPDIWKKNVFIADPHWIYPGQELTLKDMLRMVAEPTAPAPASHPTEPTRRESAPRAAQSPAPAAQPVPVARDNSVIRLLDAPAPAYRAESFMRTGFIAKQSGIPRARVSKIEDNGETAIQRDVIEGDIRGDSGLTPGAKVAILTVGDRVVHPDTDQDLGFVVRIKGLAEVISQGTDRIRCRITDSFDPVLTGDRLMPVRFTDPPFFDAWVRPEQSITATLLAINDPMLSIHNDDILYIDKGTRDGVKPGDLFALYRKPARGTDAGRNDTVGEIQAINVMETTTAVLVTSMTGDRIVIGDRAELIARCRIVEGR